MLPLFEARSVITLEEICTHLQDINSQLLEQRLFYDMWIILHQKSPIDLTALDEDSVLYGIREALGGITNQIKVVEYDGVVQKVPRFEIKNMLVDLRILQKEGEAHEL